MTTEKKLTLFEIRNLLENNRAEEARAAFNKLPDENSLDFLLLKGSIEQKFQQWGPAMNAFNRALVLDSDNAEAKNNLAMIRGILNFWNPDLLNP